MPDAEDGSVPAGITWQEQEDVYGPRRVEMAAFLTGLGLKRAALIARGQRAVYIRKAALQEIRRHVASDTKVELGGLLLGHAAHDPDSDAWATIVERSAAATGAETSARSITYTQEAWNSILPAMQRMDESWTLVGSYHSHPGMGVFLSSTDLETQAAVYSQEWQVALVVDPVSEDLGFFLGPEGDPCEDWYLLP